jgi:hypothetical protein
MANPTTTTVSRNPRTLRRAVAVAIAGATIGVTGAAAIAATTAPAPVDACRATESDLLRAAYAARQLEAERPEVFEMSPRPADYDDLRLAAEWARRLDSLDPQESC